jgi:hypothetical protein
VFNCWTYKDSIMSQSQSTLLVFLHENFNSLAL